MAQRRNIMVDICHFCCVNYFVFSGSQRSVTDVFKNTAGKQPGILKNERKQAAKITSVHVPDINSVNFDGPAVHIVETKQQIHQRGLSSTGRPDNRNHLSGLYLEADIFHQKFICVTKLHVVKCYVSLNLGDIDLNTAFLYLFCFI